MRYQVQATVEYTLEVEANSEEEAIELSYDTPFEAWDEHEVQYDAQAVPLAANDELPEQDKQPESAAYWPQEGDVLRAYLGGSRKVFLAKRPTEYVVLTLIKGAVRPIELPYQQREHAEQAFSHAVAQDAPKGADSDE